MHICPDEINALLSILPNIQDRTSLFAESIKHWWRQIRTSTRHQQNSYTQELPNSNEKLEPLLKKASEQIRRTSLIGKILAQTDSNMPGQKHTFRQIIPAYAYRSG
jgi:ribosomal protein L16 Arg81 hydroxylase